MGPAYNTSVVADTVNGAWEQWFGVLKSMGMDDSSRDGAVCGEVINAVTIIHDPTRNIVTSPLRKLPMRYAVGELIWYLSGSNKLKDIANFSKVWERLSDDGETVNSAYGYRIFEKFDFNQWEYAKLLLEKDPNSRQAIIHIKEPCNTIATPTKDLPCTLSLQFLIREGKLHLTVYMRSNDILIGFPYDVFTFTCLQMKMAFELGVEIGTYTHIAGSLHLYSRNLPKESDSNATESRVQESSSEGN